MHNVLEPEDIIIMKIKEFIKHECETCGNEIKFVKYDPSVKQKKNTIIGFAVEDSDKDAIVELRL